MLVFTLIVVLFASCAVARAQDAPPSINLITPSSATLSISGTVPVQANAWDDNGIASVQILDGSTVLYTFGPQSSGEYAFNWNTKNVANGTHNLSAVARDGVNNPVQTAVLPVTVNNGSPTIINSNPYSGSTIGIRVSDSYGGAIYSLIWKSVQFLSSLDFGSELQANLYLNGLAQRCNLSEVGAFSPPVPSVVNYTMAGTSWIVTDQSMAYAYPPVSDAGGCGNHPVGFHKTVTANYHGLSNVFEHDVAFTIVSTYQRSVPLGYTHGTFVVASANAPKTVLAHQYYYNTATQTLRAIPDTQRDALSNIPTEYPILVNDDQSLALGLFSRGDEYGTGASLVMPMWRSIPGDVEDAEYLNEAVCRFNYFPNLYPGTYKFKCYTIIGSLTQVTTTLDSLYSGQ
jgi:hypothetical protein